MAFVKKKRFRAVQTAARAILTAVPQTMTEVANFRHVLDALLKAPAIMMRRQPFHLRAPASTQSTIMA